MRQHDLLKGHVVAVEGEGRPALSGQEVRPELHRPRLDLTGEKRVGSTVNGPGLAAAQGGLASLANASLTGKSDQQVTAAGQQAAANVDAMMTSLVGGRQQHQIQAAANQVPQALCDQYATIYQTAYNNAPHGQEAAFAEKAVVNFFALQNLCPNLSGVGAAHQTPGVTDWATRAKVSSDDAYCSMQLGKGGGLVLDYGEALAATGATYEHGPGHDTVLLQGVANLGASDFVL